MPSNIINLNKARKAKTRADQKREAEQNRAKFGRTQIDKARDEEERRHRETLLDGAALPERLDESHDDLDPGNVS